MDQNTTSNDGQQKSQQALKNSKLKDKRSNQDVRERAIWPTQNFLQAPLWARGLPTQSKTMTAKRAHRGFFETYDNLKDNRRQLRLLLKPNYLEAFDNDTKRMLEETSNVLKWTADKAAFLRDIVFFWTEFAGCWKKHCEETNLWSRSYYRTWSSSTDTAKIEKTKSC